MNGYDEPSVILSAGPVRVSTSEPDPDFEPRPVGFVCPGLHAYLVPADPKVGDEVVYLGQVTEPVEPEPLLWEGDQA